MDANSNDIDYSILKNILSGLYDVHDVKAINSFFFIPEHYKEIEAMIKLGKINEIEKLPPNNSDSLQYYYVLTFKDQNNTDYAVTIYDSAELSQDPQLIEVFPI